MRHYGWCNALVLTTLALAETVAQAESPALAAQAVRVFAPRIAAADVRPHIEYLAGDDLHGRSGADAKIAAAYLVDHFRQHQLKPLFGDRYDQPIPGHGHTAENPIFVGRNIGGWIEGSDPELKTEFVIIGVHYDHLGVRDGEIFTGADDNASGVAMMLELAEHIAKQPTKPKRSVVFIGFDLEEHMLWGSRWFAAHPPWPLEQVKLFITADMISRSLGDLPLPAVFVLGSEHAPQLKRCLDEVGQPEGLEIARLGIDLVGTRSDYGPFRDREVPFLFFSTGEHPDYHTPRDRPERADFDKAARVSSLVLEIVTCVANTNDPPVWSAAVTGDLDEPKALERITTLLLEGDKGRLTDIQRYMVSTVRSRCRKILDAGQMTPDDRVWLVRMAQLLLLSVF